MNKIDKYLASEKGITLFSELYDDSEQRLMSEKDRYSEVCAVFSKEFGSEDYTLFNTPGRTELSGNHTDHNNGMVLAGSINLDVIAAARINGSNRIIIHDIKYREILKLDLDSLEPVESEKDKPEALIRGVAAAFVNKGFKAGGFDAVLHSEVMSGSGLSSSAALEILIGSIYNRFYNNDSVSVIELALAGQYAENNFFGKPCGLMDQIACASGGIVGIDFKDPENPDIDKVSISMKDNGLSLIIAETGGSHADLTPEYSAIPIEMKQIAEFFGKSVCREIQETQLIDNAAVLRAKFGDRAFLRVMHYMQENNRVARQLEAVKSGNIDKFLDLVNESGTSSWKYLQNITPAGETKDQGMAVTLAVTEQFVKDKGKGAVRVHGGGFAGTILAIIPAENTDDYISYMNSISPNTSARVLNIRQRGAITISF